MRPIATSAAQKATGATMELSNLADMSGAIHITPNTPRRAIAISRPIARAFSLPSNHFAMALETVVPAISQPHPKIMNPRLAILALPGIETHQLPSQPQKAVAWNQSEIPTNLMAAPTTIRLALRTPVKRMPILSRMMPARMRKPHTLRMYSDAAYVPKVPLDQPLALSTRDFSGDITSTNM